MERDITPPEFRDLMQKAGIPLQLQVHVLGISIANYWAQQRLNGFPQKYQPFINSFYALVDKAVKAGKLPLTKQELMFLGLNTLLD